MELSSSTQPPVLQPLTLGQLLDRSFRLYRRHFLMFVAIAAASPMIERETGVQVGLFDFAPPVMSLRYSESPSK